jgi:hypothetical protein
MVGVKSYPNLSLIKPRISSLVLPQRPMKTALATAWAPLMPSGWLCLTAALLAASARTASREFPAKPTGLTRMAEPLPQLL